MNEDLLLINDTTNHDFELLVDGRRAYVDYKQHGDKIFLMHTEVPVEIEGHGVGTALVEKTFKYLEENHLKIVPYCPFIKAFLKRHPEWDRLLA